MMAVVHDLAEAQGIKQATACVPPLTLTHVALPPYLVGDIAPREGIPKAEKRRLEAVRVTTSPFYAPPRIDKPGRASSGSDAKLCARDAA